MNVMSYDIHEVWDKGNVHTGPYVKPHANWTEIEEGLDLLWRAGVQPSKINIGLGWYGRSFTLANPSCKNPDGVCLFSQGGSPGECTKSAGTLMDLFASPMRPLTNHARELMVLHNWPSP
jgi:chitinase